MATQPPSRPKGPWRHRRNGKGVSAGNQAAAGDTETKPGQSQRGQQKKTAEQPLTETPPQTVDKDPAESLKAEKFDRKQLWFRKGIDKLLGAIESSSIEPCVATVSSSQGFHELCSYSWRSYRPTAIYVPGSPSLWKPPTLPYTIQEDTGVFEIDQNAARWHRYPFEPMFQALSAMKPDLKLDDVQIITNRNSLRMLHDFAGGRAGKSFRIDVQLVNDTLFLIRREVNDKAKVPPGGYGHNFEQISTQNPKSLRAALSHHRAIRYMLGDLKCVVQFEVDAYCAEASKNQAVQALPNKRLHRRKPPLLGLIDPVSGVAPPMPGATASTTPDTSLASALEALSVTNNRPSVRKQPDSLLLLRNGAPVRSSQLAEIKSCSLASARVIRGIINTRDYEPQLWFGRVPFLLIGLHRKGNLEELIHKDVSESFPDWEKKNQANLQKLVSLLKQIRAVAAQAEQVEKGQSFSLVFNHKARPLVLEVFTTVKTMGRRRVLPQEFVDRHWKMDVNASTNV